MTLIFPVVVLDAPLMLASTPSKGSDVRPVPWVRVVRRHTTWGERRPREDPPSLVDVVHKSFFESYLENFAEPYCQLYSERLETTVEIVLSGSAILPGWDFGSLPDDVHLRIKINDSPY